MIASFIDLEILVIMENEAYFVRHLITLFVIPFIETDIAQEIAVRRCSLMQVIDVDYRFEKNTFLFFLGVVCQFDSISETNGVFVHTKYNTKRNRWTFPFSSFSP